MRRVLEGDRELVSRDPIELVPYPAPDVVQYGSSGVDTLVLGQQPEELDPRAAVGVRVEEVAEPGLLREQLLGVDHFGPHERLPREGVQGPAQVPRVVQVVERQGIVAHAEVGPDALARPQDLDAPVVATVEQVLSPEHRVDQVVGILAELRPKVGREHVVERVVRWLKIGPEVDELDLGAALGFHHDLVLHR